MAITGGFGMSFDLEHGGMRQWVMRDGVQRWTDTDAVVGCDDCLGRGEYFTHTDDCVDDLCALNGDYHSCIGKVVRCGCMPNNSVQSEPASAGVAPGTHSCSATSRRSE